MSSLTMSLKQPHGWAADVIVEHVGGSADHREPRCAPRMQIEIIGATFRTRTTAEKFGWRGHFSTGAE
jgi:hypothetical protein